MTAAQSTAAVLLSATLALQYGPALTAPPRHDTTPPAHDAPRQDAAQTPAAEQDAPPAVVGPAVAWRSAYLPPDWSRPVVLLVGPIEWAERVRKACDTDKVEWSHEEGAEKRVAIYRSADDAEYVDPEKLGEVLREVGQ